MRASTTILLATLLFLATGAWAGTTWDGGGGGDLAWETAANWDGDELPAFDGTDDIVFDLMAALDDVTVVNGAKSINSLTLNGDQAMSIIGDAITLQSGNVSRTGAANDVMVSNAIELGAPGTWNMSTSGGSTTTFNGPISDGGNGYGMTFNDSRALALNGVVSVGGNLIVDGATKYMSVALGGDNSARTGDTIVNEGGLYVNHDNALGSGKLIFNGPADDTYADFGSSTGATLANAWAINGPQLSYTGNIAMTGAMDPLSQNLTIKPLATSGLTIDSDISDGGAGYSLTFDGWVWRHFRLGGNNTFGGGVIHKAGFFYFASDNCVGSGDFIVDGMYTSIRAWNGDRTIANDMILYTNMHDSPSPNGPQWSSWARFDMIGSGSDGTLTLTGKVILADPEDDETFRAIFARGRGLDIAGGFHNGPGGDDLTLIIDQNSSGNVITISGASTHTGGTRICNGIVLVNNTSGSGLGSGPVTVVEDFLGGTGSVAGAVTVGPNGGINPGASIGTFTVNNNVTFENQSRLRIEIDGAAAYDVLAVNGAVTLGDIDGAPTLEAYLSDKDIPNAAVLTILQNDGADPIVGTFDGLAEGGTVNLSSGDPMLIIISATATISYVGGTGNDITLTDFVIDALLIGDMDGSGAVNNNDITPFVLALTDRPTYLATYPGIDPDVIGDIDGSGVLNNNDITLFVTLLTTGSYPQAVPEPATMALLALGGLVLLKRRSR